VDFELSVLSDDSEELEMDELLRLDGELESVLAVELIEELVNDCELKLLLVETVLAVALESVLTLDSLVSRFGFLSQTRQMISMVCPASDPSAGGV
jgi:hypothetical protein